VTRREFLATTAAGAAAQQATWNAGPVRHLLPGANHERFLIKASFERAIARPPLLRVGDWRLSGQRTDSEGEFWQFDVDALKPGSPYALQILDSTGKALTDPWTLKTMPHPDENVQRFRLMIYTCAGGHDGVRIPDSDQPYWVSVANRRKLFAAGLAMRPDAMVAIGDHVYWDQRFSRGAGTSSASPFVKQVMGGDFQRDIPVIGTHNERKVKRAAGPQVAELYGTLFRGVPVHFVQDDHDYFENDEAIPQGISFPPDDSMMRLARAVQHMYYPEFLPNPDRPPGLAGASAGDRGKGISECYGTLRFGKVAELLIYDCRRYQTLKGPHAGLVPEEVETWLKRRMKESPAANVVNVPSMPIAWSAGKWGEWYPDLLLEDGTIGTKKAKYYWQEGWKLQHDRLLRACSDMPRIPLWMSGDLHALAHGKILRNGAHEYSRNPIHAVLTGPVSTGPRGWPSSARGTPPLLATGLEVEEDLKPLENNGFTIVDFLADRIEFQMFRWKIGQPESLLDQLKAFHTFTIRRVG